MHDEPTPTVAERDQRDKQADHDVLYLLSSDDSHRPWSVEELARELNADPSESLARLKRDGMIHRLADFVWAARPAVRARELHDAC